MERNMLEPSIKELMDVIPNRFLLVNAAAHRARNIADDADDREIVLSEKPISMAIEEISDGRLKAYPIISGE